MEHTIYVRLKDEEVARARTMKEKEKRTYASLIRVALDEYYEKHYAQGEHNGVNSLSGPLVWGSEGGVGLHGEVPCAPGSAS